MVNLQQDRNDFTRHGMHMNNRGKMKTSEIVSGLIKSNFFKQQENVIQLEWKGNSFTEQPQYEKQQVVVRSSNRMRKQPQRSADFLGTTQVT